jgi:hypothetical protein
MPDVVKDPMAGPDAALSDDREPTRGDWHTIAVNALVLLGMKVPATRLEATRAAIRIKDQIRREARNAA